MSGSCDHETRLARLARDRLQELLAAGSFSVERSDRDRYGRTLATIRVDGRDVTNIMVGEGLVHIWRGRKAGAASHRNDGCTGSSIAGPVVAQSAACYLALAAAASSPHPRVRASRHPSLPGWSG
ncbi:thermonuclease family protein [Borborobacter arsenicus]|uniref:thermonuclease family protein n=1 Tax=Borborobacter arsenicus TaxID=1851146 RepID=UPI001FDFDB40|nr:thermonuclease family protein [Pseudaminobacter arsenicus]